MSSCVESANVEFSPLKFYIDPATFEHIGEMALVLQRANAGREGQPLPHVVTDFEKSDEIDERIHKPEAWAYMARVENRMVGFALGHSSETEDTIQDDPKVEYLALLMVEPELWGQGIGQLLLVATEETARNKGKEQVVLWTAASKERTRRFYENYGFRLTENAYDSERQGPCVQYLLELN